MHLRGLRHILPQLALGALLAALLPGEGRGQTTPPNEQQRWAGVASLYQERAMPDWVPQIPTLNGSPDAPNQAGGQAFWDTKVKCQDFETTPPVIGLVEMRLDRPGTGPGTALFHMDLQGAGTRQVRILCAAPIGSRTYTIRFSANMTADLQGTVDDSQNVTFPSLTNVNIHRSVSFVTCVRNGQPMSCPTFKNVDLGNLGGRLVITATTYLWDGYGGPDHHAVGDFTFKGNLFTTHGGWDVWACDPAWADCDKTAQAQIPAWREQLVCPPGVPATMSVCDPTASGTSNPFAPAPNAPAPDVLMPPTAPVPDTPTPVVLTP